ncbi:MULTISPECIES: KilA-N domain-containing protein [Edwardsiella]|uniref:KilA-N domain protein n=2 Tax=Edwardsiella anguillarum TaxID=1821960 RepID=A0A076LFM7_9GAMM|nr:MULTISPECIES: KilA-N domain-containing protein [Edwardsiella]AIJ07008.1 putative KilA protein [Edwardsiella anguillarum ET080813]AIJ07330.1 kilA-N domain protein [Edwardsiella anguillarum ET080813]AKR78421.1 KilA-N domain-containing protein [Edwardsiella sp. LADL05-105]KAB0584013.1 KilA-N domain-containing protein [Edwardsiella anguillarum]UOU78162.1 KilA-N domain-containing protein [Edwardsiella anguillarum]
MSQLISIDGICVRQDVGGRFCLNDLHRAAGGEKRHQPTNWLALAQTKELIGEIIATPEITGVLDNQPTSVINGGDNRGTYACKELVYAYAMWISAAFNLKVIRTFDAIQSAARDNCAADKVQAGIMILESAAKTLNLSNSSKLAGYQKLQQFVGIPELMPAYAIDAPSDAADGSSRPTSSLTAILKRHNIPISTPAAYRRLVQLGIVQHCERPSCSAKAKNGVKAFWAVTARGCQYGKNITSPNNPRETQPHFFDSRAGDLLKLMMMEAQA